MAVLGSSSSCRSNVSAQVLKHRSITIRRLPEQVALALHRARGGSGRLPSLGLTANKTGAVGALSPGRAGRAPVPYTLIGVSRAAGIGPARPEPGLRFVQVWHGLRGP